MLSVSNEWRAMFEKNLVSEALIKFDIENYGILTKRDVFSYTFKGKVNAVSQYYPEITARVEVIMREDYLDFNAFIGKYVDIYYGFVINGSDEYVKALKLYIDDIAVSDDGTRATFTLKSILAFLTENLSIELPIDEAEMVAQNYNFTKFLNDALANYSYVKSATTDYYYRHFNPKVTLGNALQEMCFTNLAYFSVNSDGDIVIKNLPTSYNSFNIKQINILNYPKITKQDVQRTFSSIWFNPNDDDVAKGNANASFEITTTTAVGQNYRGTKTIYFEQDGLWTTDDLMNVIKISGNGTLVSASYTQKHNNYAVIGVVSTAYNTTFQIEPIGYSYNSYKQNVRNTTTAFSVNITTSAQSSAISNWLSYYFAPKKEISVNVRHNPMYELMDYVFVGNSFNYMFIEEMNVTFKGSYQATLKGRCNTSVALYPTISVYSNYAYITIFNQNDYIEMLYMEDGNGDNVTYNTWGIIESINPHSGKQWSNFTFSASDTKPKLGYYLYLKSQGQLDTDVYVYTRDNFKKIKALLLEKDI